MVRTRQQRAEQDTSPLRDTAALEQATLEELKNMYSEQTGLFPMSGAEGTRAFVQNLTTTLNNLQAIMTLSGPGKLGKQNWASQKIPEIEDMLETAKRRLEAPEPEGEPEGEPEVAEDEGLDLTSSSLTALQREWAKRSLSNYDGFFPTGSVENLQKTEKNLQTLATTRPDTEVAEWAQKKLKKVKAALERNEKRGQAEDSPDAPIGQKLAEYQTPATKKTQPRLSPAGSVDESGDSGFATAPTDPSTPAQKEESFSTPQAQQESVEEQLIHAYGLSPAEVQQSIIQAEQGDSVVSDLEQLLASPAQQSALPTYEQATGTAAPGPESDDSPVETENLNLLDEMGHSEESPGAQLLALGGVDDPAKRRKLVEMGQQNYERDREIEELAQKIAEDGARQARRIQLDTAPDSAESFDPYSPSLADTSAQDYDLLAQANQSVQQGPSTIEELEALADEDIISVGDPLLSELGKSFQQGALPRPQPGTRPPGAGVSETASTVAEPQPEGSPASPAQPFAADLSTIPGAASPFADTSLSPLHGPGGIGGTCEAALAIR